jgi:hypothetical protein
MSRPGDHVERNLVGVDLAGHFAAPHVGLNLRLEFIDRIHPGAGDGLVGRGEVTFQAERPVQRPKRHQRDRGRAVGVGDDALVVPQPLRIDFRNDQRHISVHPVGRTLVDHDTARLDRIGRKGPGDRALGCKKRHVDRGEHPGPSFLDRVFAARAFGNLADRPRRGEQPQRGHREISGVQELQQFLTGGAGRADDGDINGCFVHR